MLLAIPAGVWADRSDRRRLILRADWLRAGALAGAALLAAAPPSGAALAIGLLAALAFATGAAEVVRDNAAQTVLPALVPEPRLEAANGRLWTVEHVMGAFVGPPLAGFLFALAVPAPFAGAALAFALAALVVWRLPLPARAPHHRQGALTDAREGWQFMRRHPVILRLAVVLGCLNALSLMAFTVLVLFSQEILGLSATGHGILLTAGAAGGVTGGLIAPWIAARLGPQRTLNLALACMPLPLLVLGLSGNAIVAGAALFFETLVALLWNVVTVSYRQRAIPDDLLGRVNSLYRFFGWGMMPLGALAAGAVVDLAEPGLGRADALRLAILLSSLGLAAVWLFGRRRLTL